MSSRSPIPPHALLEHRDFVRRLARRLVADESLADDVAQQAWLAALTRPPRDEGVRAWLRQVVRRLAMRHHRGESRRLRRETAVARGEARGIDVATDLAHHEVMREVTDAVVRLAPRYREVVMLHFYRGLSADEIARRANVPRATVYTRLRRALALLRADLERRLGGRDASRSALAGFAAVPLLHADPQALAMRSPTEAVAHGRLADGASVSANPVAWSAAAIVTICVGVWVLREAKPVDERTSPTTPRVETLATTTRDGSTFAIPRSATTRAPLVAAFRSGANDGAVPVTTTPAASAAAPAATVSVRIVWADTLEPVPDRGLRVLVAPRATCAATHPASDSRTRLVELRSDANGVVELRDVAPGVVRFVDHVGPYDLVDGTLTLEVTSGDDIVRELRLPRGRTIEGRVFDRDEQPVAGASVWTSDYYNRRNGRVVATTDAEGTFVIHGVSDGRWIAAHAPEFAPSRLIRLAGAPGDTLRPHIVLDRAGASVYGTVTDREGRAIADARIDVTAAREANATDRIGNELANRLVRTTETNLEGTFRIPSIAAGTNTLSILASGYAPQCRTVVVEAGNTAPVEIVLDAAVAAHGIVFDVAGRPVESVEVTTRTPDSFGFRMSETNAAGAYALGGLAPGTVLRYRHPRWGVAEARVDAAPGENAKLDVVLERGTTLDGSVVDSEGRPLVAMLVRARGNRTDPATGHLWSAETTTSEDGAFSFVAVPDEWVDLTVSDPSDRERALGYSRVDARDATSDREIRIEAIVIDRTDAGTGIVRGRAVGTDGAPVRARFSLRAEAAPFVETASTDADGSFSFSNVTPGTHRLVAEAEHVPSYSIGDVTVQAGGAVDLGAVVLDAPGTLSIDVAGFTDLGPYESVRITTSGHAIQFEPGLRDRLVVRPGLLRVTLVGREAATECFEVDVRPGESVRRSVSPRDGVPCRFEIDVPHDDSPHHLGIALYDARGLVSYDVDVVSPRAAPVFEYRLLPGEYRLVVAEPQRDATTIPFTVSATDTALAQRIEYPARRNP